MTQRSNSLRGLSPAEAEAEIREFIDDVQEESLANLEIDVIDCGANQDDAATVVELRRAEHARWRSQALVRLRELLKRGFRTLN